MFEVLLHKDLVPTTTTSSRPNHHHHHVLRQLDPSCGEAIINQPIIPAAAFCLHSKCIFNDLFSYEFRREERY